MLEMIQYTGTKTIKAYSRKPTVSQRHTLTV